MSSDIIQVGRGLLFQKRNDDFRGCVYYVERPVSFTRPSKDLCQKTGTHSGEYLVCFNGALYLVHVLAPEALCIDEAEPIWFLDFVNPFVSYREDSEASFSYSDVKIVEGPAASIQYTMKSHRLPSRFDYSVPETRTSNDIGICAVLSGSDVLFYFTLCEEMLAVKNQRLYALRFGRKVPWIGHKVPDPPVLPRPNNIVRGWTRSFPALPR